MDGGGGSRDVARMRILIISMILALALTPASFAASPNGRGAESITYTPGCGYFPCRDYTVTVSADGTGWFTGRRDTAVRGKHRFRVTKAEFAAFKQLLAPYRPARELLLDGPGCREMATDQESVDVRWTGNGTPAHLSVYYGCDMTKNEKMFDALRRAPKLLPLARLLGRR